MIRPDVAMFGLFTLVYLFMRAWVLIPLTWCIFFVVEHRMPSVYPADEPVSHCLFDVRVLPCGECGQPTEWVYESLFGLLGRPRKDELCQACAKTD